jgi:hypothetical protein
METCERYKERWFEMELRYRVCYNYTLRDKGGKTIFLISAENLMDPGEILGHLLELSVVEEMIIARTHV